MTRAITDLGYETPTEIQIETIPILLKGGTDFLGLASTGTGKTAAFAIPLLENLDREAKGVQGLVLCPTRELAKQVAEQINLLARYMNTKAIAIYGGSDYGGQLRALKEGVSIVVGTPGRIIDHIERKTLNLDNLKTVILDEADEMISMGFREEIEFILETVNQEEKHQTWLFSATMSRDVRKIADQFLKDPKQVQINKAEGVPSSVTQYFFQVHEDQKPEVVEKLIDSVEGFYGLIFCQTKALVIDLTDRLKSKGFAVDCIHGDMDQTARERTLRAFKAKVITICVCTDVASRGIDVKDLTHVINYSLPRELDLYVHRIGRTGRGGAVGIAWALVNPSHMHLISRIEKTTRTRMTLAKVPTDESLLKLKVARALTSFNQPMGENPAHALIKDSLLETGWKEVIDLMSREEIVTRFLTQSIKINLAGKSEHESKGFSQPSNRDAKKARFGGGRFERSERFGGEGGGGRYDRGAKFDRGGAGGKFGRDDRAPRKWEARPPRREDPATAEGAVIPKKTISPVTPGSGASAESGIAAKKPYARKEGAFPRKEGAYPRKDYARKEGGYAGARKEGGYMKKDGAYAGKSSYAAGPRRDGYVGGTKKARPEGAGAGAGKPADHRPWKKKK
jgi:ATP-dependent RNA helicase DeaD